MERLLLRIGEAAEMLGKSRSAVYQLIAQGVLPAIRVGKSLRVPVVRLHSWIEEQLRNQLAGSDSTNEVGCSDRLASAAFQTRSTHHSRQGQ